MGFFKDFKDDTKYNLYVELVYGGLEPQLKKLRMTVFNRSTDGMLPIAIIVE